MDLVELLETRRDEILMDANLSLSRSHLVHYNATGRQERQRRLQTLYDLALQSVKSRHLETMRCYVEAIAQERYAVGFDLYEVQMAFNVLEEAIWRQIIEMMPAGNLAEAIGLVSTVLGAGKDTLAQSYVAQACKTKAPSLNMMAMFEGTDGV